MIYDNGSAIVGDLKSVIKYVKKNKDCIIGLINDTYEELLESLEKLDCEIVMVEYGNGFNYSIEYFTDIDNMIFNLTKK